MSTRCNIIIKDSRNKVVLYHHHDGYPQGIGQDLKEYLTGFRYWYGSTIANGLIKRTDCVNYEISFGVHDDIEYLYVIDCNKKTLKCYERKDWNVHGKDLLRDDWEIEL